MSTERKAVVQHLVQDGLIHFTVAGAGTFSFDPASCSDETEASATLHGYVQKISDKAAIQRDPATGRSATPAEKFARMKALADHLQAGGAWIMRQAARATLNRDALFAAVAAAKGLTAEAVVIKWGNMPDDFLRIRLTDKDVAAEYARLTTSGSDSETLFEGLE